MSLPVYAPSLDRYSSVSTVLKHAASGSHEAHQFILCNDTTTTPWSRVLPEKLTRPKLL